MTRLSLKNPIAILMICIGLVVFAAVVTPRMSIDTFPELTPAGPGGRHAGARSRSQGRREDDHLAHREVRQRDARRRPRREHVAQQSQRRLRVAQVGDGPQLRADAGPAAGRVRDVRGAEVARRPAAVRAPVRSFERAGHPGRGVGRRSDGAAALRLRRSTTSSRCSKESPASPALRSTAAGNVRSTSSSIRSRAAGAARDVDRCRERGRRSPTRSCLRGVHLRRSSTPTSTRTPSPSGYRTSATPP